MAYVVRVTLWPSIARRSWYGKADLVLAASSSVWQSCRQLAVRALCTSCVYLWRAVSRSRASWGLSSWGARVSAI
eukprot:1436390-Amphidinium_carterae.1